VEGIMDGDPAHPDSQLIPRIDHTPSHLESILAPSISRFGRGGMITKCRMALRLARVGVAVHIVNGKRDRVLSDLMQGWTIGTTFPPRDNASPIKRWIAHSEGFSKGTAYVNEGALQALQSPEHAASLLPVGVIRLEGDFQKGDILRICSESGSLVGVGVTQYGSLKAQNLLGKKNQKPLVHYDYLFLNDE
jgi:glutamate 5-kinase